VRFPEVEQWVRAHLPPAPARVLEVGAGDGTLARSLRGSGYDVTAIDPKSQSADVLPLALSDLDDLHETFDAAVAVVSLHHVEPLEASIERLASVMHDGSPLLVDEFDVSALDERAASWWLAQRIACGAKEPEMPAELVATMRSKIHSLDELVHILRHSFDVGEPERGTYLYRWKLDESLRPAEEELAARGELPRTGARFIASRRARPRPGASPPRARRAQGPSRS
jgi:hypothetical protein